MNSLSFKNETIFLFPLSVLNTFSQTAAAPLLFGVLKALSPQTTVSCAPGNGQKRDRIPHCGFETIGVGNLSDSMIIGF